MTTSEAWRYQLRAEGVERRPPPRPDRGYIEQPGEESKPKSVLSIPLSVLRDEEEKAIMAELLEEERLAKQLKEEDERQSGIRPPLPPPPEPSAPRRRIVTRGDLRPERQPLRASLADFVNTERPAPENETAVMPVPKRDEPDHIDQQIQALLAKHEAAQHAAQPKEHPTLLSRPQPPPEPVAAQPDEWEDFHEAPTEAPPPASPEPQPNHIALIGADGRKFYTPEFRRKTALEFTERRRAGENVTIRAFADSKGVGHSLLSRWLDVYAPDWGFRDGVPPAPAEEPEMPKAHGRRERRVFTDHDKLDILDKVDELQRMGHTFKGACEEVDVVHNVIRTWQDARKTGKLKRPPGRRPAPRETAPNPKAPGPRSSVQASLVDDDNNEERTVGVVMAELQAAKQRVEELKAELIKLL